MRIGLGSETAIIVMALPTMSRTAKTASNGSSGSSSSSEQRLIHLSSSYVYLEWESAVPPGQSRVTLSLADSLPNSDTFRSRGHLLEGPNIFVAFLDKNGDNVWTPGEPYGAVAGVDVGWSGTSCAIELTETTPKMLRIDLAGAVAAADFLSANALTDRGQSASAKGFYGNEETQYPGTNMPSSASLLTKVRVVRTWINDSSSQSYTAVVFERDFDLTMHPTLTESDLLGDGVYDLDWGKLLSAYDGTAATLDKVTYRIVIGDGDVGGYENFGNNLPLLFSNRFETRLRQTPTVPDPNLAQIVYAGRPTFRWSHANSIDKAYPAFRLRIYASDETTVVYDSGVQQAPARDENGMYEWTAPVYAGMVTAKGKLFKTTENYFWSVSMLDAKFTNFSSDEKKTPFRLSCTGNINDGRGYGSIKVAVKYFGPMAEFLSATSSSPMNLVHVQAFATPDFTGVPAGEAYVTNVADVASVSNVAVNAIIRGVPPGTYYVRAFLDTNGNCKKDPWETWGYGCYVGDGDAPFITITRGKSTSEKVSAANFPYTPRGYTVAQNAAVPEATIYMEDADTDGDGFPDAWEMQKFDSLGSRTPITGSTFFATVNPDLLTSLPSYNLGSSIASSTANLGFTLMDAILSGSDEAMDMAADLLSAGSRRSGNMTAVSIKSFSLEDGLSLEVVNVTAPVASDLITFNDEATVTLVLACSTAADFSDAVEVPVKTITIRANDTVVEAVTAEELAAARTQAPNARFFKAVIK